MTALPLMDAIAVCARLSAACKAAGSQKAWGDRHGLSSGHISDVLNARRPPGDAILRALGLAKVVKYVEWRKVNG